jgi:hypothetical protein
MELTALAGSTHWPTGRRAIAARGHHGDCEKKENEETQVTVRRLARPIQGRFP